MKNKKLFLSALTCFALSACEKPYDLKTDHLSAQNTSCRINESILLDKYSYDPENAIKGAFQETGYFKDVFLVEDKPVPAPDIKLTSKSYNKFPAEGQRPFYGLRVLPAMLTLGFLPLEQNNEMELNVGMSYKGKFINRYRKKKIYQRNLFAWQWSTPSKKSLTKSLLSEIICDMQKDIVKVKEAETITSPQ